ncbi:hypothetical protein HY229_03020, partial [Candidatus Acetothermia bacterium]|nr:hypothetical protein [Candidatus Acetothermia bacterium]MBI3643055.1 hypothetical protein [Candidatus Acetothermia bacterium]
MKKIMMIDIDGVVCKHVDNEHPEQMMTAEPYVESIAKINEWYDHGHGRAPLELYQSKVENRRIKEGAKQMKKSRFSEQQVVQILAAGDQGEK